MINILSKIFNLFKSEEQNSAFSTPENATARFKLTYKNLTIGFLILHNGVWTFVYSDEFKEQSEITHITDFPNKLKEYRSSTLFPFFAFRIPSQQRLKIQNFGGNNFDKDEVSLLKRFGKQSVANPYHLLPIL